MSKFKKSTVLGGFCGTVLEWFDFSVYIYLAPIISTLFFPHSDKALQLIMAYAVFAIGFLARPIGGMLFGHLGDKYGRKRMFAATLLIMTVATVGMGCLPTYQQAGLIAPALLVILRFIQGIAVGGEIIGSNLYMLEYAPAKYKRVLTTTIYGGSGIGVLFASLFVGLLTAVLTHPQLLNWGWRLPFLFAVFTGVLGYLIRRRSPETPVFKQLQQQQQLAKQPLLEAIQLHWRLILRFMVICVPVGVTMYLVFVFMPTYASKMYGVSMSHALLLNSICLLVATIFGIACAQLSNYVSAKKMMLTSLIILACISIPLFYFFKPDTLAHMVILQLIFAIVYSGFSGVVMPFMLETAPVHLRYSIVATAYNLTYSIFAGTVPIVVLSLIAFTGDKYIPAYYLTIAYLVAILSILTIRAGYISPGIFSRHLRSS